MKINSAEEFFFSWMIWGWVEGQCESVTEGIQELITDGKFDILEEIFEKQDPRELFPEVAIAFLSASLPVAKQINNRKGFYLKTWEYFAESGKDPESSLIGLKGTGMKITTCAG